MLGEECSNLVTLMRAQPLGKEGYSVRDALGDYGKSPKESVGGRLSVQATVWVCGGLSYHCFMWLTCRGFVLRL